MKLFVCPTKCCQLLLKTDIRPIQDTFLLNQRTSIRSGVFLYDPVHKKILLVQTYGKKWGFPKGKRESFDCSFESCAIRELQEETGIVLNRQELSKSVRIHQHKFYFVSIPYLSERLPDDIHSLIRDSTEITGIAWLKDTCLSEYIHNHKVEINFFTKRMIEKCLKETSPCLVSVCSKKIL